MPAVLITILSEYYHNRLFESIMQIDEFDMSYIIILTITIMVDNRSVFEALVQVVNGKYGNVYTVEIADETIKTINAFMEKHNLRTRASKTSMLEFGYGDTFGVLIKTHSNDNPDNKILLELVTKLYLETYRDKDEDYYSEIARMNYLLGIYNFPFVVVPIYKDLCYARRVDSNLQ